MKKLPFPVNSLPYPIAKFIKALSVNTQTPSEMAGVLSLGVLATTMHGRYKIKITSEWSEPLNLYTVAIAEPGERKSAVISHLTKPLEEYEAEYNEKNKDEIAINKAEKEILEKSLASLKQDCVKNNAIQKNVNEKVKELENFKELHLLRLTADDTIPEKLVDSYVSKTADLLL